MPVTALPRMVAVNEVVGPVGNGIDAILLAVKLWPERSIPGKRAYTAVC
jgi:hypothetical protein